MKHKHAFVIFFALFLGVVLLLTILVGSGTVAVLDPKGIIADKERTLIISTVLLMLIVVIPVFILAFFFAWHYRASNTKATYMPDWEHAKTDELIWWAIPFEIVLVIGALTWQSTHDLDPRKPIDSPQQKMTIQVVALPWKWLFIYPKEHIATVNFVEFPANTPIDFEITADAPMNSFWIPQLGGQIYAMTGMVTHLHLVADEEGVFRGSSANYSGTGFAQMKFIAKATSQSDFTHWQQLMQGNMQMDATSYKILRTPSVAQTPAYYSLADSTLFDDIVSSFNSSQHYPVGKGSMQMQ